MSYVFSVRNEEQMFIPLSVIKHKKTDGYCKGVAL